MSGCVQNFTHLFTPEEDSLIIELKESGKGLTWSQISEYFPDRSKGTLQVRYCRQLSKAKRWKKRARLSSRNRPRKTAAAGPKLDKHDAKIVEAVDNSAPHRMTTRSAALPTTNDQPEKTCRHAANDQPVDTAESLVTAQPMRTTKPVAKRLQLDRKKVTLVRPTPPDGWRVIDPSDPALTENEYTPKAFLNPPANRVVEYNSRSGSFRCRTRRAEDEKQQRFRVSQQVDGNDHELDTSDTVTEEGSMKIKEELKRSHNYNKKPKWTRRQAMRAGRSREVDGEGVDYVGDSEATTNDAFSDISDYSET